MLTATPAKQNQVERPRQACFSFSLTQTVRLVGDLSG